MRSFINTMSSKKPPPAPPAPRLYLATPPVADAAALAPALAGLLAAADIAAVLVRLADADERSKINRIKALAATIQNAGRGVAARRPCRAGRPRGRGRRACERHRTDAGCAGAAEAGPHCRRRRAAFAPRFDGCWRSWRRLRAVRRAGRGRPQAIHRGDRGAARMVGRAVRTTLRRLCQTLGRGGAVRGHGRGVHHGGRCRLVGRARSASRAGGCGKTDRTGSCGEPASKAAARHEG